MRQKAAGAAILAHSLEGLKKWVLNVLKDFEPEKHGRNYKHQFFIQSLNDELAVCFYVITGYQSHDENVAFEHAFFVIEEFMDELAEEALIEEYLIFVDVGDESIVDFVGFPTLEDGLNHFNTNLATIRAIRENIKKEGQIIWE